VILLLKTLLAALQHSADPEMIAVPATTPHPHQNKNEVNSS
jgi:hypothetical protein